MPGPVITDGGRLRQFHSGVTTGKPAGTFPARAYSFGSRPAGWLLGLLLLAGWWLAQRGVGAAEPATEPVQVLTNFTQVRRLSTAEARRGLPMQVRAVVTYYEPKWDTLFLHDGTSGIYVYPIEGVRPRFEPGQWVEFRGSSAPGGVVANAALEKSITVLGRKELPAAMPAGYRQLVAGKLDGEWVEVEGVVRAMTTEKQRLEIDLALDGGRVTAHLPSPGNPPLPAGLMHARVRVRGMCGTMANDKDQLVGARLFVPTLEEFRVLAPGVAAEELPLGRLGELSREAARKSSPARMRLRGTVTLATSEGAVYLQDGGEAVEVSTARGRKLLDPAGDTLPNQGPLELKPGDRVEMTGYPELRGHNPVLREAVARRLGRMAEPTPVRGPHEQVLRQGANPVLVEVEARLARMLPPDRSEPDANRWQCQSGNLTFEARWEGPEAGLAELPSGSKVRLTGVRTVVFDDAGVPRQVRLLLRSPAAMEVLQRPSRWLTAEILRVTTASLGAMIALLGWALFVWREAKRTEEQNQSLERVIEKRTRELSASEARYKAVLAHTPEAILVLDADSGRFTEANENACRLFGLRREELLGRGPAELSPATQPGGASSARLMFDRLREALAGEGPIFEWTHRTEEGREFPCEVRLARLPDEHRSVVIATLIDITARKRAEAELLNAVAREKELNELKSSFVSLVSHEFRTPLGVIMSSSEILRDYLDRLTPENRDRHLGSIFRATKNLSQLIEEVLLLSKVEEGKLQCKPVALDLVACCRHLADEVVSATSGVCAIEFEAGGALEGAMGDESMLRHILTNLLSNAVKYSRAGTVVDFRVAREGEWAVFRITDRGIGIPPEDQKLLFSAFRRGRNVEQRPGTGLGLVIVKRCAELHGGQVQIESRLGEGTTATVRLPLFRPPAEPARAKEAAMAGNGEFES